MTIKPIINQKSNEKKESQESSQQNIVANNRANRNKSSVEVQGSQLRNDVYEDITRHRRSPHKLVGRSKREHHHKRGGEQRDREKCSSPQYVQSHSTSLNSNSLQTAVCNNNQSGKSPKHITTTSPIQLQQNHQQQSIPNILEEQYSGYNSGDEHLVPGETLLTPNEWKNRDEQFMKAMSERGFIIQDIVEDGACLFRAISLQIYGDQEMHEVIRQQTMDYIYQNREYFAHFVTEDINNYVKRKRNKDSHGNHIEIQAMSEIYNRPVELYCYQTTPINIFNSEQINNGYDPLRLSYQRGSHYNAILDPYNASVGVGLGLAGYKPESQTREAIRLSEQLEIEKTMFEDKLKTTDWEATNEAIEEQIARESYLQWCRESMQKATRNSTSNKLLSQNSTSSTVTSADVNNLNNNISSCNVAHCETTTVASCILNESTPSLKEFHNNNNCINSNGTNNKSNLDSNCDREQISDQQQTLNLSKTLLKKKDGSYGAIGCCNSNNNSENTMSNECNSQCDSDDTDVSSTSSADQYQHYRLKSSSKHIKSPRRLKRRQRAYELKRKSIELNETDFPIKRFKQCLESSFQHYQQRKNSDEDTDYLKSKRIITTTTIATPTSKTIAKVEKIHDSDLLPSTSKQVVADNKPISQFYQSLLESSYTEDGLGQLSENEMLQKAIKMSRMDFIEEQKRQFGSSEIYNNGDDERVNLADEDSDTLST